MNAKDPIQHLIDCLAGLPGIGEKTATRLALFIVNSPNDRTVELAESIMDVTRRISLCSKCYNYTEQDLCGICANPGRDTGMLCVVESPADLMSIEKTGTFNGGYHVLHGVIAPLDGIGPDQLRIRELIDRIQKCGVTEVILATNPTMNGNATAGYISDQIRALGVTVTRIAQGIPPGGDIGYADRVTLKNALEGRREMK